MPSKKPNSTIDLSEFQHTINGVLHSAHTQVESIEHTLRKNSKDQAGLSRVAKKIFQASRAVDYFTEIQNLSNKQTAKPVDVESVIEQALVQMPWELGKRGVSIAPQIIWQETSKHRHRVLATARTFELVLIELLDNALAFGDGRAWITIQNKRNTVLLQVENRGKLSTAEIKIALSAFESFGENKGNGLGLSLAQSFAAAMGGTFGLKSSRGKVCAELTLKKYEKS